MAKTGGRLRHFVRVQIAATTRTDLLCIACGQFGAGSPMLALIAPGTDTADAHAGLHRRCLAGIKAKRESRRYVPPELVDLGGVRAGVLATEGEGDHG